MPRCCEYSSNIVGSKLLFIETGNGCKSISFTLTTLNMLQFLILESFPLNPRTHKKLSNDEKCRSTEANDAELGTYVTRRGKAYLGRKINRLVTMVPVKCHHVLSYTKDLIVYFILFVFNLEK